MRILTDYNYGLFNHSSEFGGLKCIVDRCVKALSTVPHFDSIAFRGVSGSLVAPAVSLILDKALTVVRREQEDTHSSFQVEGLVDCRYVILDDCVFSGKTARHIQHCINRASTLSVCVGIYLYRQQEFFPYNLANDILFLPRAAAPPTL